MSLNTKANSTTQKPIPPVGQHLAVCFCIIDLGTQLESFKGAEPKPTPKIHIGWEFCSPKLRATFDKEKGEQPMAVFQKYSYYLGSKANFGKMIKNWVGKEITELTYEQLIKFRGRSAMIQVEHNPDKTKVDDKTKKPILYANIASAGTAVFIRPEEIPQPKSMSNEWLLFSLDHFSWEVFNKIPKFLQETIMKSAEWAGIQKEFGQNPLDKEQSNVPEESIEEEEESANTITSSESSEDLPF